MAGMDRYWAPLPVTSSWNAPGSPVIDWQFRSTSSARRIPVDINTVTIAVSRAGHRVDVFPGGGAAAVSSRRTARSGVSIERGRVVPVLAFSISSIGAAVVRPSERQNL